MATLYIKKKTVDKAEFSVGDQLLFAFNEVRKAHPKLRKVEKETFREVGQIFLRRILDDKVASKNLLALLAGKENFVGNQEPKSPACADDIWLKTDDAAKRMGFSRPYVVALIDAGEFGEGVIKNPSGHRRVKVSAIVKWMADHGVSHPLTTEHQALLDTVDGPEFFEQSKVLSKSERSQRMETIQSQRAESLKYKPVQR